MEASHEVLSTDLNVLHRRRVVQALLQLERPGQAVCRDLWHRFGDVGVNPGASVGSGASVVRQKRSRQTAPVKLPRVVRGIDVEVWIQSGGIALRQVGG